jgi:hypothetical protein
MMRSIQLPEAALDASSGVSRGARRSTASAGANAEAGRPRRWRGWGRDARAAPGGRLRWVERERDRQTGRRRLREDSQAAARPRGRRAGPPVGSAPLDGVAADRRRGVDCRACRRARAPPRRPQPAAREGQGFIELVGRGPRRSARLLIDESDRPRRRRLDSIQNSVWSPYVRSISGVNDVHEWGLLASRRSVM